MKPKDPLALAVFGAALALLAGLLLYVFLFKTPEPAPTARAFDFVETLRHRIAGLMAEPTEQSAVQTSSPGAHQSGKGIEAGRSWRYAVVVEPPAWRDITLTYRTQREGAGIGVLTEFVHADGKMNFHLGTYAAGHASHANTRFPGFFMYASYFPSSLKEGQQLSWSWAWQPVREGRFKRYEGRVARWENVQVPAGVFAAAVIETALSYEDQGSVRARVKETLWYVPKLSQVVKVLREGRAPDEGARRIVAELTEYR